MPIFDFILIGLLTKLILPSSSFISLVYIILLILLSFDLFKIFSRKLIINKSSITSRLIENILQ
jgi:positive regulator of sigma E activity